MPDGSCVQNNWPWDELFTCRGILHPCAITWRYVIRQSTGALCRSKKKKKSKLQRYAAQAHWWQRSSAETSSLCQTDLRSTASANLQHSWVSDATAGRCLPPFYCWGEIKASRLLPRQLNLFVALWLNYSFEMRILVPTDRSGSGVTLKRSRSSMKRFKGWVLVFISNFTERNKPPALPFPGCLFFQPSRCLFFFSLFLRDCFHAWQSEGSVQPISRESNI